MKLLLTLAAAAALLVPSARADDIDAKTQEWLKKVGVLYKEATSLHAEGTIETTQEAEGKDKREIKFKVTIDMKRPNSFALRSTVPAEAGVGLDFVSDGKSLFTLRRSQKEYMEVKAPAKLPGVQLALQRLGVPSTGLLFQNVLADDPAAALLEGVTKGEHAGTEKVDGKEAHHLKFKQPLMGAGVDMDWDLWIAAEGHPFVLKAKNVVASRGKATTVETYTNWKHNVVPEKDPFAFTPPEGAKKVDRLGGVPKDKDK